MSSLTFSRLRPAVLAWILAAAASIAVIPTQSHAAALPPRADILEMDLAATRMLLERSLDWRARTASFIQESGARLTSDVLTAADLERMYSGAQDYVMLRRRWQALLDCQGDEAWSRTSPTLQNDPLARVQTKLVLAVALMQHDDYRLGVEPFFNLRKARRLLKSDNPAVEGEIDSAVRHFLNPLNRARLARAVVWYRAEGSKAADRSEDEILLDEIIAQSPGYAFFTQNLASRTLEEWRIGGHAAVTFVTDLTDRFGKEVMNTASLAVGNTVGLVETRKGFLTELPPDRRAVIASRIRPLDVLLEKTPFRLTDASIPGHYGHVAIWVGTEAELRELDLWENPLVRPHHDAIRNGARIVEALRPGVQINTLDHFLNIDDLLVLRRRELTLEQTRAALLRTFAQIGKEYDFNFDVESDKRIVCSELAFVVFASDTWPTSRVLGRASISPDQVAVKARPGGPFETILMYHDGVEITDQLPDTLCCLLDENPNAFVALHPAFKGRSE
ncbi:MAG: YiiX/YebB-like N1pC/P60 family cysteine hydrolase [Nibricoccus sp.]